MRGIAGQEGSPADDVRADLLRDDLLGGGYAAVDRLYERDGAAWALAETFVEVVGTVGDAVVVLAAVEALAAAIELADTARAGNALERFSTQTTSVRPEAGRTLPCIAS